MQNDHRKEVIREFFEFEQQKIQLRLKEELSSFEIGGISVRGAPSGAVIEVPFFIAETLVNNNIGTFEEDPYIGLGKLDALLRLETRRVELQKIDKDVLVSVVKRYHDLDDSLQFDAREKERIDPLLEELLSTRIEKILKLVHDEDSLRRIKELTSSERLLLQDLSNSIASWKKSLLEGPKKL